MKGLTVLEPQERFITKFVCLGLNGFKLKSNIWIRLKRSLVLTVISFSNICLAAKVIPEDEPYSLSSKNVYAFYGVIALNCVGALGWVFKTYWDFKAKRDDRTQETLELLMSKIDGLSRDVHHLSINSVSKSDATNLIREEMKYREEIRGK